MFIRNLALKPPWAGASGKEEQNTRKGNIEALE